MPLTYDQKRKAIEAIEETARTREMMASRRDPKENDRLRAEAAELREIAKEVERL